MISASSSTAAQERVQIGLISKIALAGGEAAGASSARNGRGPRGPLVGYAAITPVMPPGARRRATCSSRADSRRHGRPSPRTRSLVRIARTRLRLLREDERGRRIGGASAHARRGAADRRERRQAAGTAMQVLNGSERRELLDHRVGLHEQQRRDLDP